MKNGSPLRGLFIAIGVIDFVAAIFSYTLLLSATDTNYFMYIYYSLFAIIGIGVINAILSMVIPAIKGGRKALPGFVFSLLATTTCLFTIVIGQHSVEDYKKNQEEKKQQKQEEKEKDIKNGWLSPDFDLLSQSDFELQVTHYAAYDAKYEGASAEYKPEGELKVGCPEYFQAAQPGQIHADLANKRINDSINKYTHRNTPIELDYEYKSNTTDGSTETRHSYFVYGNYGYLHLEEVVKETTSYTNTSQTFTFVNDEGRVSRLGFVETVVRNANPTDVYKCQYVFSVVYNFSHF